MINYKDIDTTTLLHQLEPEVSTVKSVEVYMENTSTGADLYRKVILTQSLRFTQRILQDNPIDKPTIHMMEREQFHLHDASALAKAKLSFTLSYQKINNIREQAGSNVNCQANYLTGSPKRCPLHSFCRRYALLRL